MEWIKSTRGLTFAAILLPIEAFAFCCEHLEFTPYTKQDDFFDGMCINADTDPIEYEHSRGVLLFHMGDGSYYLFRNELGCEGPFTLNGRLSRDREHSEERGEQIVSVFGKSVIVGETSVLRTLAYSDTALWYLVEKIGE
ncbi:MAG: hypothetical protein V3V13_03860 [Paracoccaceae bacterium]